MDNIKIDTEFNNILLRSIDNVDIEHIVNEIDKRFNENKQINSEKELLKSISIRLNYLLCKQNKTAKYLSIDTNIAESTLSEYRNGLSMPSIYNLSLIAKSLNCSIDYLVGYSNCESIKDDYKTINKLTNLSSKSIEYLKKIKDDKNEDIIWTINFLLENDEITNFLTTFYDRVQNHIKYSKIYNDDKKYNKKKRERDNKKINRSEIDDFLLEVQSSLPTQHVKNNSNL